MAECLSTEEVPEVLFWVGCAGSFDDRAKKVTKAFAKLLVNAKVSFAVLGQEESCSGDYSANYAVESWAVSATSKNSNTHCNAPK